MKGSRLILGFAVSGLALFKVVLDNLVAETSTRPCNSSNGR
jgi:hypothetical protein